ncbi:lipase member H-B-like [Zerene cesonia]|uniref:lipase member H-B-like n=1 Tax=Zerene cesonia TaxID=33412 RepID=UPI0018E52DC7|nr:lipase member H-B-like [Zerene cesonia]
MFPKLILVSAAFVACNAMHSFGPLSSKHGSFNVYYLYTRSSLNPEVFNSSLASIQETSMIVSRNTTIIVHGHGGTGFNTLNPTVKDALLRVEDADVIIVDWSQYSLQSYSNAVNAVPSVGTYLGLLINQLVEAGVATLDTIHIVGFGLGAHVAGYAGRGVNGHVARITGLDPSGNQWGTNSNRLRSSDAKYVEVIHTDGFGLGANGIGTNLGHTDIYANGGEGQPGCLFSSACSHQRAWELFAASLTNNHLNAHFCNSFTEMRFNRCRGFLIPIGTNAMVKFGSGVFRINTGRRYPY